MVKQTIPFIVFLIFLSSCSTFKPLNFTSNKPLVSETGTVTATKFIDEISLTPKATVDETNVKPQSATFATRGLHIEGTSGVKEESNEITRILAGRSAPVESASSVQLKYAVLLNTEVESLPNKSLLEAVDEWYGVRYRKGGNTKSGVDCSGFTVAVYASVYGLSIPRVSREQYRNSRKISTTELQEGDLVFFNTNGSGVSHVGVYLGNNKFIHASVSKGIMVNDLFESYYLKRYIGAGRVSEKEFVSTN